MQLQIVHTKSKYVWLFSMWKADNSKFPIKEQFIYFDSFIRNMGKEIALQLPKLLENELYFNTLQHNSCEPQKQS
jgi:hypothetical protein